ncbi:MAG: glycosyltransferase family 4 protein [Actinobacteria bacterium]|nr:glycosyltransferase family 4 protein [Actinomycetota bacterium]
MKFGVNALRLSGQRLGIGRYIEYLLKDWDTMLEAGERVVVYVREPFDKAELGLSEAFEVRHLPSWHDGVRWEHFVLARHWRETDVLFCPSYTVPLHYRGRLVVATHSVNEAEPGSHPWWYHLTYRQRNKLSARRSDAVIVPSQTTEGHVEDLYGVPSEKITIVPEGAPRSFAPVRDEAVLRETRRRYLGDDVPYVLFVGKASQRRNIPALIEAFARVKRRHRIPHKLLLFGPNILDLPLSELTDRLGVSESVVQTDGRIQRHEDILPVYSGADLFVHPTTAEGFSLTIVEAMACGLPVVTVGRGVVAEIVGEAAITVDAPTPEQLEEAIWRVLSSSELRADLGKKAIERSQLFRLDATARGTLDVMRQVGRA